MLSPYYCSWVGQTIYWLQTAANGLVRRALTPSNCPANTSHWWQIIAGTPKQEMTEYAGQCILQTAGQKPMKRAVGKST